MLLGFENVYLLFFSLKNKQQLSKPCDDAANNENRNGWTAGSKNGYEQTQMPLANKKL